MHDANQISHELEWLKTYLHSPDELDDPNNYRAIFWFKSTAHAPMKRIWAMRPYLEAYGHFIELITCWDPGHIIYQDKWQIAAKPKKGQRF